MRVNYRNWAALQICDIKKCQEYIANDKEHFFCAFNAQGNLTEDEANILIERTTFEIWGGFYTTIKNIYFISHTFFEALNKSAHAFLKMLASKEDVEKVHEDCAFLYEDILWVVKTMPNGFIRFMRIKNEGCLFTSFCYKFVADDRFETYESTCDQNMERRCVAIYYLLMFLKLYGKAEVEIVAHEQKIRSQILKDKTLNETGLDVKILDSRWFTTICRNEGFMVSGHFRLQPKKDENGEWTRELIYIEPYAKKGYHRLAKVINVDDNK